MELALGLLGMLVSLAIAYWEHRKAKRAEVTCSRYFGPSIARKTGSRKEGEQEP